ncbi:zinc finger SWIM domain-containing protein 7 isoform X2 [Hypomesus transpacificus]|uniref:zinc finger SWIM domain-containing protein 7 isoform X2 n=1 Tax=Hypomesus transpacificus TaxID=137520 RepID=UPI001F07E201|nr:zinc finger SWIM domain-containing protein 7 isoform X2 [Hypomesus transpacificus]
MRDVLISCSGRAAFPRYSENVPRNVSNLRFVFGSCALQALDLVDQRSVTCVSSPSGRKAFQVLGGSGKLYTCFISCHFCPCPAFAYTVLRRNESLLCKHILAAYLSQAMGVSRLEVLSDQQMSLILSGGAGPEP